MDTATATPFSEPSANAPANSASPAAAAGKILRVEAGRIVFQPHGTTYELHLAAAPGAKDYDGPLNVLVSIVIRTRGRKAYTVPSGGLFVTPILGTPKIFQGRVTAVGETTITLACPVWVTIDLPRADGAVELARGGIAPGTLVNVVGLPGAWYELVEPRV